MTDTPDPLADRNPAVQAVAEHFTYDHLPPHLQAVSRPFTELRDQLLAVLPDSPELTVGLRKMLEAKDCAVRCAVVLDKAQKATAIDLEQHRTRRGDIDSAPPR